MQGTSLPLGKLPSGTGIPRLRDVPPGALSLPQESRFSGRQASGTLELVACSASAFDCELPGFRQFHSPLPQLTTLVALPHP